jgi:hypothetical protein
MKRKTFNIIALFALLAVATSCATAKRCSKLLPVTDNRRDTVTILVKETIKDTTVVVPADSSWLQMLIECNEEGEALKKELVGYRGGARMAPPKVTVKNNVLTATCEVDSAAVYLMLKSRDTLITKVTVVEQTMQVPVNIITWWQQTQIYLFWALAAMAGVLLFVRKIIKI